jgi:hypothetical protein
MGESERGCGYRKAGGVYLVCDGVSYACDGLPVEMVPCGCCEFEVKQARSMQPISSGYMAYLMRGHKCKEEAGFLCPVCFYAKDYPKMKEVLLDFPEDSPERKELEAEIPKVFYLMFVSKEYYTPQSFMEEARLQGVSKRVAPNSLPAGFRVGVDWVFLGHGDVPFPKTDESGQVLKTEYRYATGIFYAFKPSRLELVLYKGSVTDQQIADYEEAGYTVVLLENTEENLSRHGPPKFPPLPYHFKRKTKAKKKGKKSVKNTKRKTKN